MFLVGQSGSGKSTFIRLLLKELDPTEGSIIVGGRSLGKLKRSRVAAAAPQHRLRLPGLQAAARTATRTRTSRTRSRCRASRRHEIDEKVPEILQLVGLGDKIDRFPHELSGGEQQRVSIARAFVNHPPLLICDEPTGNLDPDTSVGIMQLLYRINRTGTTVVMATHDREMVDKMRRRVIALERGRLVRDDRRGGYVETLSVRRADFFFVEAVRSLRNNLATTLAATVTVLIVLYFLGVFVLFGTYLYAKVDKERSGVRVTVYLDKRATHGQITAIGARLRQNPDVKPNAVEYVSKAEAWQRLKARVPKIGLGERADEPAAGLVGGVAREPEPRQGRRRVRAGHAGRREGRERRDYGGEDADRLLRNAAVVEPVIGGLILVLAISAVALIANTIRLSIFARRREVEVMKLVGASNWFVRLPFVLEGMLCGLGGAVLSIALLGVSLVLLKDHLPAASLNEDGAHAIAFWLLAPLLLLAGTLLGALGSGVTMRRFLRV